MEIIKPVYMEVVGDVHYLLTSISHHFTTLVTSLWHLLHFQLIVGCMAMLCDSEKLLFSLNNTTAHYERPESGGFGLCSFCFLQSYMSDLLRHRKFSHHPYPDPPRTTFGGTASFFCNYCSAMWLKPIELNWYWSVWRV